MKVSLLSEALKPSSTTKSERELLSLLRLGMEYTEANLILMVAIATRFATGDLDDLDSANSAFLLQALFKYGQLSLAFSVVRARGLT